MVTGREGTTIGPYRLARWLGRGGAGDVYLADGPARPGERGPVAVKLIAGSASDPIIGALAQQAQVIAALDHPNILPVYASGREHDTLYIAMAYAPDRALAAQVRLPDAPSGTNSPDAPRTQPPTALPLPSALVALLVSAVASALGVAHASGVVHGDLTPANIFVRGAPDGTPQVAVSDFGQGIVVRMAAEAAAKGASWASAALACAAPEQLTGAPLPTSDQYALATIAYLLLAGHYPFAGDGRALGSAILHEPPPPPRRFNPAIPPAAEAVLLRALAKAPSERYPDVAAFAQALCAALAAPDTAPSPQVIAASSSSATPAPSAASFTPTGIAAIDRTLTWLDRVTGGKAGGLVHLGSYLMSGGFAAVVNLACLYLVYNRLALPVPDQVHYILAYIAAAEVSIIANFLPNDSLTFRHMAGHARPWWQRLLRFHSTTLLGLCVTLAISYTMHYGFGLPVVAGQAVAIVVALVFNFTFHHVWTYRRLRSSTSQRPLAPDASSGA